MRLSIGLFLLAAMLPCGYSLDNGLALTPPMGWLTWERFRCQRDCVNYPDSCISEHLIKNMTDCLVSEGYKDAGYEYVTIDDCWLAPDRDSQGRLQPDPDRFPSGIKALADYVHSKGLKFGIYEDFGTKTCAGFPGSEFYMQQDAKTFADWGIDLLKFDGCNSAYSDIKYGYPAMKMYLNQTGRPILYSCEWPLYDRIHHHKTDFAAVRDTCNMWRNYDDGEDTWVSVESTLAYFAQNSKNLSAAAGPGGWNDPDELDVGNYGLSHDQERVQMAMWTILASPLTMSMDACNVNPASKTLLQNKRLIAVNQDKLGVQGTLILNSGSLQLWARPILPQGSRAFVIINYSYGGYPQMFARTLKQLGLTDSSGYQLTDAFTGDDLGSFKPNDNFKCLVNPSGCQMITAVPLK